ncbi:DNA-binding domain-containing protein [Parendozoicomonas haliclonae]|uniref:Putative DNA-binding domain-containing protein n=1 Tax=Parendozoicomonas haliclonae TaxID=1960125 RepID=A0A1X7AL40_9GAMM|nr:DNA-binding domain-containing protein [Parendozoicomonas haliclonae]SMA48479.1 hypothetical protein EHSB41UT_02757 [Parendozoicomonas haliclonae]
MTICQQSLLLQAIYSQKPDEQFDNEGLAIYQNNLAANAARSLSITYPTITALVGESILFQLAQGFIKTLPLTGGDWAAWGESFPGWLEQHPITEHYPYLADCARLDWTVHSIERAGHVTINTQSFEQLASPDALNGFLQCHEQTRLMTSDYPIVDIYQIHDAGSPSSEQLQYLKQLLQQDQKQTALLWRKNWKAEVKLLSPAEAAWMNAILQEQSLDTAFENNSNFPFDTWLPEAIADQIITGFQI